MRNKVTSQEVATRASNILRNGSYSQKVKSVAGSALSQTVKKKPKRRKN